MLVFLLTTFTRENKVINICSKPVHDLKAYYLCEILMECLGKARECEFEIVPIFLWRGN